MQALELDFVRRRRFAPLGLLLAAAGAAMFGAALLDHLDARESLARAEARQARLERQARAVRPATKAPAREARPPAERALAQLRLPWDALLREVELIGDPAVALLSFEGQGAARTLRLTGEAKGMADAVAYLERLRASPWIDAAHLTAHEERQSGSVKVLRFTVEANWSGPP